MASVYLGLGSNLGDRAANIKKALQLLESQVDLTAVSPFYETEPVGIKDQPWFLNAVCAGQTALTPQALLEFVKGIENEMGRTPTVRFGPRVMDIDILFYEDLVLETPTLQIPHPRLTQRAFVLVPLAQIAPHLVHPRSGLTIQEILAQTEGLEEVRPFKPPDPLGLS
jgi:2-amino-4-hydroxy-6-hydroxymethyldihydropteridine diphosphokinase